MSSEQHAGGSGGTGTQGPRGFQGETGATGSQGAQGAQGTGGAGSDVVTAPRHPLAYRIVGTRPGVLNNAGLSASGIGTNAHRRVKFPYGAKCVGIAYANVYSLVGGGLDGVPPNAVLIRASLGKIAASAVPSKGVPAVWWDNANKRVAYVDDDAAFAYTLPPSDVVIFNTGESVEVGGERWVHTYAIGDSGGVVPLFETKALTGRGEATSSSIGETDKTTFASATWGTTVTAKVFEPFAIVDLGDLA